ncbi:hypothetical protein N7449_002621 [Penicillium cf. viridicatum]|uniref:Uncharacterized protein n=1 Tax=Penicillium cf. viridicatum TaxID=2972119 RepID=A0A9W9MVF3_9EURO|nr:hypothetical protein N7449_002621 [Penicillium cf. viridicatum]
MDLNLDLSLPSYSPELGDFRNQNLDSALYTLVDLSTSELESIASLLDEWMRKQGNEGPHLVRLAPSNHFVGKSLNDIVTTHIQMDKEETPRDDAGATGDLSWYPSAFLAVTSNEWKKHGILFVYADTEQMGFPMDKFFFVPKDGYMMLSSIIFGDEECARSKEEFAISHEPCS